MGAPWPALRHPWAPLPAGRPGPVGGVAAGHEAEQLSTGGEMQALRHRAVSALDNMCRILEAEPLFVSRKAMIA